MIIMILPITCIHTWFQYRHTSSTLQNHTRGFVSEDTITVDDEGADTPFLPEMYIRTGWRICWLETRFNLLSSSVGKHNASISFIDTITETHPQIPVAFICKSTSPSLGVSIGASTFFSWWSGVTCMEGFPKGDLLDIMLGVCVSLNLSLAKTWESTLRNCLAMFKSTGQHGR
jgi:hypothetical protein